MRIETFINSFDTDNPEYLRELENEACASQIPVIRHRTQEFLKFMLELKKPKAILEVGTAVGFSALLMREYSGRDCRITTIENYEPRIEKARHNFELHDTDRRIEFLCGDAADILPKLPGPYDFIFMDAAKGQYINFLPEVIRLLDAGGVLISDNILQEGDILESRFAVTRRNRTIHARMRDYLYEIKHCKELSTIILELGDGTAVSVRRDV